MVCYSDKYFVNSSPDYKHLFENRKRKEFKILEHLLSIDSLAVFTLGNDFMIHINN